jgi:hypothetical protein
LYLFIFYGHGRGRGRGRGRGGGGTCVFEKGNKILNGEIRKKKNNQERKCFVFII